MRQRSPNWDLDPFEERLLERLREDLATRRPPIDHARVAEPVPARAPALWRRRSVRSISALAATGAIGVVLALVWLSSGGAPAPALALAILRQPAVTLPAPAAQVARQDVHSETRNLQGGPVDTSAGRAFPTPWGRGYVLSDPARQIACVLMNPWNGGWQLIGCIGPQTATHTGGNWVEYWGPALRIGRRHPHTAVDVAVMAEGGTLTARPVNGRPGQIGRSRPIGLHEGVAVTLIRHTTIFTARIDGHTTQSVAWNYPGFEGGGGSGPPSGLLREVKRLDPGFP